MAWEEEQEAPHAAGVNWVLMLIIIAIVVSLFVGFLYKLYTDQGFCKSIVDVLSFIIGGVGRTTGTIYGGLPCGTPQNVPAS